MADFTQDEVPPVKRPDAPAPAPEKPSRMPGMYVRERVLIACVVLLIALFAFTIFLSRQYHRTVHRYADEWFAKGEKAQQAGQTAAAITDFRNALVYKREDPTFQFHLAQALAAAGQDSQARASLLSLLSENPGSGPVNLTLARVSVHENNAADAVRYYHSAIYGVWNTDPFTRRWDVRRELCEYLLGRDDVKQAEPDLIALAQDLPPQDVARKKIAAQLLLRAGLWNRALTEFKAILQTNGRETDVLADAGRAAFELGNFPEAAAYLQRLPRDQRQSPATAQMLQTSKQAITLNPFQAGLSTSEQAKRAARALNVAKNRLLRCAKKRGITLSATSAKSRAAAKSSSSSATPEPAASSLQQLYARAQQDRLVWTAANLAKHPGEIPAVMTYAFQAEAAADKECGISEDPADRALRLIRANRVGRNSE